MKKNIYYFVMGVFALLGTVSCSKSESEESAKYQNLPQEAPIPPSSAIFQITF